MKRYQIFTHEKARKFIERLDLTRRAMKKTKYYTHEEMHRDWMKDPKYRHEYEKLEPEFRIASAIIEARIEGKITQAELAERANTGQAVISRLENMNARPSLSLIQRIAEALGLRVDLRLLPQ